MAIKKPLREIIMGLHDTLFDLHGAYRRVAMDYKFKSPSVQQEIFKSWRQYAVLTANDLQNKPVAPHDLDDSVSEVLLDIILGFDPDYAGCNEDDLVHAMHFDPLLHRYINDRLSDADLFHVMKGRPTLAHKDILQGALDRMEAINPLPKAA